MIEARTYLSALIPKQYLDYFAKRIEPKFCRVATTDSRSRPFVAAFRFGYDDRDIFFSSFSNRQTIKNIRRNPNVAVIVDRNDEHPTSYCTMRGTAKILTSDDGADFDYALSQARETNKGLADIVSRHDKGDYNKGGEFLIVQVAIKEIFSRMA